MNGVSISVSGDRVILAWNLFLVHVAPFVIPEYGLVHNDLYSKCRASSLSFNGPSAAPIASIIAIPNPNCCELVGQSFRHSPFQLQSRWRSYISCCLTSTACSTVEVDLCVLSCNAHAVFVCLFGKVPWASDVAGWFNHVNVNVLVIANLTTCMLHGFIDVSRR